MRTTPVPADIQQWSDELARDPESLVFLPLARAYRRQGRLDLAVSLCRRGLEQNPGHVDGHALLALLYLARGDRARAAQEWSTILRFQPRHFEALRGMGFRYLEQDDLSEAQQHLERAALIHPADTAVQEALEFLRTKIAEASARTDSIEVQSVALARDTDESVALAGDSAGADAGADSRADPDAPVIELGDSDAVDILELADVETPAADGRRPLAEPRQAAAGEAADAAVDAARDPTRLFDSMLEGRILGVLLVDGQGRVLAGRLADTAAPRTAAVGALIGGTAGEAARVVEHLGLRAWKGMTLVSGSALIHLSPAGDDAVLVTVARRDSPRGWLARAAHRAAALTEPLLASET